MMQNYLYDSPLLPKNFQFPVSYRELVSKEELPNIEPWSFLARDMASSLYYFSSMLLKFPGKCLIPFAFINDVSGFYNDGWVVVACFDAGDPTTDSCVRIYDFSKPKKTPWDNFKFEGFDHWLAAAEQESIRFREQLAKANAE